MQKVLEEKLKPRYEELLPLAQAWEQIVGTKMSRQSRVAAFSAGILDVVVSSPVYRYELGMCAEDLVGRLNDACGHVRIKKIKFRIR